MTTTITINRATVEQAYEALWYYHATEFGRDTPAGKAIAAFHAALAQQAEPTDPGHDVDVLREHVRHLERRVRELHAQQAEPVEPVAIVRWNDIGHISWRTQVMLPDNTPLYTTPPRQSDPQIEDRLARHGIPMPGDPK